MQRPRLAALQIFRQRALRIPSSPTDRQVPAVTVVGAGGIGCALGHALRAGGVEVVFVDADEQKVEWGRRHGVGVEGRSLHAATFVHFSEWRPESGGIVLLCTKCYDNRSVLGRLPSTSLLIPVQNGFDRELIERTSVEGIASFVSECDPGRPHTRITRAGSLHIGGCGTKAKQGLPAEVERLAKVLEKFGQFSVRRVRDVLPYKHAKLMYNAAISPLAAAAGLDNGQLLTVPRARTLFFALLRENYAILNGAGIAMGKVGPFHPNTVDAILRLPLVARALALPFSRTLRGTYCSMSGDIQKGRTEIDNFNGYLIELARRRGCDLNQTVHALVSRMAQQRLTPGLHWLEKVAIHPPSGLAAESAAT